MDFVAFLHNLDHRKQWSIQPLQGGLVNLTVRATASHIASNEGGEIPPRLDLSRYSSLILKHAPPYVASIGSDAPFSQVRQTVEARALTHLGSIAFPEPLRIPSLVHHDPDQFVLVIEDLGSLMNLEQHLSQLDEEGHNEEVYLQLAGQLGGSLAHLHSHRVDRHLGESLHNPDAQEVVYEMAVKPFKSRLQIYGVSDYESLAERCAQHFAFTRSICSQLDGVDRVTAVFSMGDLWPPSILVDRTRNTLGFIDWEFAGPSLPLADLAQLAAHLQVYTLSHASPHARGFIRHMVKSYTDKSVELGVLWLEPSQLRLVLRAAVILHGREIINVSIERKEWPAGVEGAGGVKRGCDYLRWAGDTADNLDTEALTQDGIFTPLCKLVSR